MGVSPDLTENLITDESEHDRRMLPIGLLFVRMLCDFFKPRRGWKPKS
jgi:hypothetical protein